jgi:hypothetical protein
MGNRWKHLRHAKGYAVCCSDACRNARNIRICLTKTGKTPPGENNADAAAVVTVSEEESNGT